MATVLSPHRSRWLPRISHYADPVEAWDLALPAIAAATHCSPDEVRAFLDSRHGRHFADEATNGLATGKPLEPAITAAVTTWMGWTISRRLSREEGIPQGRCPT